MARLIQSQKEDPVVVTDSEQLDTGSMGGCVSVVALSTPNAGGRFTLLRGQHGGGGHAAIDYETILADGRIANDPSTRFYVLCAKDTHPHITYDVVNDIRPFLNRIGLAQFEFFHTSGASVHADGRVTDEHGLQLKRFRTFIADLGDQLTELRNSYWPDGRIVQQIVGKR